MTPPDRDRLDDVDPVHLGELVGRYASRAPSSALWEDDRFLAWLRRDAELRSRQRHAQRDGTTTQVGADLRARSSARRLEVQRFAMRPSDHPVLEHGVPARVLDRALAVGATVAVDLAAAAGAGRELWDEPAERWVQLPAAAPQARYIALRIDGDSMAPLMHTGDTVLVALGSVVRRETVIVARHPEDGYVCKRVRRVERRVIELASLDPERAPIVIPHDPSLIVGTVWGVWCHHGSCPPDASPR